MFNTETIYMLWDAEHNGETMNYLREDAESYVFDDGMELVLAKANVVDLGDDHPPANKEVGKHYISTYDGSVSYGASLPSTPQNSQNSLSSVNSGLSGLSGQSGQSGQSGGRRKSKGRKTKSKKSKKAKAKARKTKKASKK
jgi:hypothetical protein